MAIIKNPLTIFKGGEEPTLIEKTITENGEYLASSDNADGFSKVTVDVAGGEGSDWEFDQNRIIKIPSTYTGLTESRKFSHYVVFYPTILTNNLNSSTGKWVVLYDLNTQQVIHTFEYSSNGSSAYVLQLTEDGNMAIFTYQYTNSNLGSFTWLYNATNDTFVFYDDVTQFGTSQGRYSGYCYTVYQGKDFGVICNGGFVYCINSNMTITLVLRPRIAYNNSWTTQGARVIEDGGYTYISTWADASGTTDGSSYGLYQWAGCVVAQDGYLIGVRRYQYTNQTSSSYLGYMWALVGHYMILFPAGSSSAASKYLKVIDFSTDTPTLVKNISTNASRSLERRVLTDDCMLGILSGCSWFFNASTGTLDIATTTFTSIDGKICNHRGFIGTNNGFAEITNNELTYLISMSSRNTSIHLCPKNTDLIVSYSTSYSADGVVYVYHTDTDTYDILFDADRTLYYSVSTAQFTEEISGVYYKQASNNLGVIFYFSNTDTYAFIYTGSRYYTSYRKKRDDYISTVSTDIDTNYVHPVMVTAKGVNIYTIQDNVTTLNNSNFWVHGEYAYALFEYTSPSTKTLIMKCNATNNTFDLVYEATLNFYSDAFGNATPIKNGNKYVFAYNTCLNDGSYSPVTGNSSSINGILYDEDSDTWLAIESMYAIMEGGYGTRIAYRVSSSGTIKVLDLSDNTVTDTTYTPANNYSYKCMPNGMVLIKTTTAIIKYDLSTLTATTIVTTSNNSSSNSYGTIRVIDNVAIILTVGGGVYNSNTDTFTSTNHSNFYSSSYYSLIGYTKLSNNKLCLYLGSNSTIGMFYTFTNESPITSIVTQAEYNLKRITNTEDFYIAQRVSTSSSSTSYNQIYLKKYDVENDTLVTIKTLNVWPSVNLTNMYNSTRTSYGTLLRFSNTMWYCVEKDKIILSASPIASYKMHYQSTTEYMVATLFSAELFVVGVVRFYYLSTLLPNYLNFNTTGPSDRAVLVGGTEDGKTLYIGIWDLTPTELGE